MMAELSTTSLPPAEYGLDNKMKYNETESVVYDEDPVAIFCVILLISLVGLVGNGIILWFLGFRMKRTPFTVYILNLAIADTCFLLCSVVYIITYMVTDPFSVTEVIIFISYLCHILALLMYSSSLYLLTAISTERCLSVLYPIWHRCRRPRHLSTIICALVWALSTLLSGSAAFLCVLSFGICNMSYVPIGVLNVLIFPPIMVLSSLTLFIKVQCSSQRRQPGKLYMVILLTVLFFLLFAVPLSVQIFQFSRHVYSSNLVSYILASANSSINPFIYFLVGCCRNQRFRTSSKVALQMAFEEKAEPREDEESPRANPVETAT
ncbi:mas-related G-protein coupled receptor member H-like [Emydura macquarii macquarii]|uniref:mas-related G-protein coupled receptor member H-like n=1 Tax=Emydura macquarii macquarii TaxID=1129001 RepID=UPI00352B7095